jgi:predicted nucleic acid-binding protein
MRLLVDVDVVLDVLLDRRPHAAAASALWAAGERGSCRLAVSAHAVTTIFYLASRQRSRSFARSLISDLLTVFDVAAVDGAILARAATLELADFEDAVFVAAAEASACAAVVTRNLAHYEGGPLPAIDAAAALAWLNLADEAAPAPEGE